MIPQLFLLPAKYRRHKGRYDPLTRWLYQQVGKSTGNPALQIQKLRFDRDMGEPAPPELFEKLIDSFDRLSASAQRFLINRLVETGSGHLDKIPTENLLPQADYSPAAAHLLIHRNTTGTDHQKKLASIYSQQSDWRQEFVQYIRDNRNNICIIGNSPGLKGKSLGKTIDSFNVVLRFNNFSAAKDSKEHGGPGKDNDRGNQTHIWSVAPDVKPPAPEFNTPLEWLLLSGPESHFHIASWENLLSFMAADRKLITVPLSVWQKTVALTKAPPSAGLLCLAWMIDILSSPQDLTIGGFELEKDNALPYHHALPKHRAGSRHNWEAERKIKSRWIEQGLRVLDH